MAKRAFSYDSDHIITNIYIVDDDHVLQEQEALDENISHGVSGIGEYYDAVNSAVYPAAPPFSGWELNETTWQYDPPTPNPSTALRWYSWDNSTESWVETERRESEEDSWQRL